VKGRPFPGKIQHRTEVRFQSRERLNPIGDRVGIGPDTAREMNELGNGAIRRFRDKSATEREIPGLRTDIENKGKIAAFHFRDHHRKIFPPLG
jgi:hypothetical protein